MRQIRSKILANSIASLIFIKKYVIIQKKTFLPIGKPSSRIFQEEADREVDFYKKILYNIYVNNEREVITDVQYE